MVFSDTSSRLIQFKILSNIVSVYIYWPGGIYDLLTTAETKGTAFRNSWCESFPRYDSGELCLPATL